MPEYDGSIIIDTHINTDNFDKDANKLFLKTKDIANYISKSFDTKKIDISNIKEQFVGISPQLQKLQIQIFNTKSSLEYLTKNTRELLGKYGGDIFNEITSLQNKLSKLQLQSEILSNTPMISPQNISNAKKASESLKESSKQANNITESVNKASKSISNISNNAKRSSKTISSLFLSAGNSIRDSFGRINGIFSMIARRARWLILGQTIRKVFSEVGQSFNDLQTYSAPFAKTAGALTDSFKRTANAIAASFAPIINALAPIIINITNIITNLLNKMAMLTNALFTNSRTAIIADTSFSGYGKKVEKVGKATKKAKKDTGDMMKALAKFDKLDVLKKSDVGIGDSADVPELNPAIKMFKEVSIPNNIFEFRDKIINAFDLILDKFKTLANSFSNGFSVGFKDNNLDVFSEKLVRIKNTMFDIFNGTGVVDAFNRTINSLSFNLGKVVGSMSSVGVSLGKMLVGGFEKFLSQNKERIKKLIIDKFNVTIDFSNLIGRFAEFISEISTLFGEDKAQSIYGNFLSAQFNLFNVNFQNIYKLAEKTAELIADPFITNVDGIKEALDGMLTFFDGKMSALNSIFEGLGDSITSLVENSISPALDVIKNIWEDRIGVIVDSWNNSLKPVFEDIGNRLKPLGEKIGNTFIALSKPINSVFKVIVDVYNKIRPFLHKYVYPLFERILTYISSGLGNTLQTSFDLIETIIDNLSSTFSNLSIAFSSMVDIISDIINGDWKKLWEDAGIFVKALTRSFLGQLKTIPDLFVSVINMVIRTINNGINAFNGIGFGDFKINIPNIPQVPKIPVNFGIPGLATGTVVSPGREFLARLGDNAYEPEIVSPISTMKRAFSEAMSENNIGGVNGNVTLQIDGKTFARLINPYMNSEKNRVGISMVQGVY